MGYSPSHLVMSWVVDISIDISASMLGAIFCVKGVSMIVPILRYAAMMPLYVLASQVRIGMKPSWTLSCHLDYQIGQISPGTLPTSASGRGAMIRFPTKMLGLHDGL